MEPVYVKRINASRLQVIAEPHVHQGLYDYFAYRPANYKYMPAFKKKIWDGFIRMYDYRTKSIPIGLLPRLETYLEEQGEQLDYSMWSSPDNTFSEVDYEAVESFAQKLNIHSGGVKIEPHDYQIEAVHKAITTGRLVAIAPTSAGKSLILYIYVQWMRKHITDCKAILIVPSVQLVHQMFADFTDYSSDYHESPESFCHLIQAGSTKDDLDKQLYISTWQSLQSIANNKHKEFDSGYFKQFSVVMVDEVHSAKGKELSNIMDQCVNADFRLGVTGTLDGTDIMALQLEGIFGEIYSVITTRELMDRGAVATLDIKLLMLDHPKEDRELMFKVVKGKENTTYEQEMAFLINNSARNRFITNLSAKMKGNTLILLNFVEQHGKPLYDAISKKLEGTGRKVFFIHGGVKGTVRNEIRKIIENENDAVVIGSYGVLSTGVSIKRLHNLIFGSPSKSQIRVLQSLGRGLRIGNGKTHCTLYDIADDLSYKSKKNYTLEHAIKRVRMYSSQELNFTMIRVPVEK